MVIEQTEMETVEDESTMQLSRKRPLDGSNGGSYDMSKQYVGSNKPTLKFLISNIMAGKLIGKGGSNIGQLQSKFKSTVRISSNQEYYPGTTDRVVTVSADIDEIIAFSNYLISQIDEQERSERNIQSSLKPELKLVVSNVAAGLVIGKGGESIKSIERDCSGVRINISKRDESVSGERVLVISGDAQQRITACKQIIEAMSAAPDKMSSGNVKYNGFNNPMQMVQNNFSLVNRKTDNSTFLNNVISGANGFNNVMSSLGTGIYPDYKARSGVNTKVQAEMEIPDKMVGIILGKQGQTIGELSRNSGAKLQFSGKDEFVAGTTNRTLTITGGMNEVHNAYILVDSKLALMELNGSFRR